MHKYKLGLIGNCAYMAYVDDTAAVQWMCMPRFDSSFVFGGLLDKEKGGRFSVQPAGEFESKQYYLTNTNILCTEFKAADGSFRVIDFAPRFYQYERHYRPLMMVRKLECISGSPEIVVECSPRGQYGEMQPEEVVASNHIRYLNMDSQVRLTTDIPLSYISQKKRFVLSRNKYLVFTYGEPLEAPLADTAERFLLQTMRYWERWVRSTYIPDIYQSEVIRSALVLKLHQYEDTGAIIASGTTSLPESPESGRNWDYRFFWFRDSYYTLQAFNMIGHFEELEGYFDFIKNILAQDKEKIQPLYSITGDQQITERTLPLMGYMNNQPVRVGNAAYTQLQYDVYGQVLLSLLPLFFDERLIITRNAHINFKDLVGRQLSLIGDTVDKPDAGIWEFRNSMQHHCYTKLFHWAGALAAKKFATLLKDQEMEDRALQLANKAAKQIEACYSPREKAFMQAIDSEHMDASTLKLITMGYLSPKDPRTMQHLNAIERKLKTEGGLLFRYLNKDDFGTPESTFLVCSFWYTEALACVGRIDEALQSMENNLQHANSLGLFSEDVSVDGSQWGNFPQTYSHVGLINSAFRVSRLLNKPHYLM